MEEEKIYVRTEITPVGTMTMIYPLQDDKYLTINNLWDTEWLLKLPKTEEPKEDKQMDLFDGLQ